jgi:adenylate kinase
MINIVLLGAPGAGKGTQASLIVGEFGVKHVSTGEIFRQEMKSGTELGHKIKSVMDSGALVSDDIVLEVIEEYIKNNRSSVKGFLFDGFPRTVPQAEGLEKIFNKFSLRLNAVIYIDVPDSEVVRRLSSRRACPRCGRIYNIVTGPFPKEDLLCDVCKVKLETRSDDTEEVIKERLDVYRRQTSPLVSFYSDKKMLSRIDGRGKIEEIFLDIKKVVSQSTGKSKEN